MESSDGKPDKSEQKGKKSPDFSDHEQDIAHNAQVEFEGGRYDACLGLLSKLEDLRPKDAKVLHNKAVTEFYKCGCTKTDEFLKALQVVKKKMNHKTEEGSSEVTDVDRAVLFYNKAVYYYYVKKYTEVVNILEVLLKILESLDQTLAQNVCFLLVEVFLVTYQTEKASGVLSTLEKLVGDASKCESEDSSKKQDPDSHSAPKLDDQQKLRFHKLKARLHLLQKSIKACKKEIKPILNMNNMGSEGLFIKSNFEYVRHNERKAVKLLNSAPKDNQVRATGESVATMYFNNLGCLHFQLHKYNLASFYFCRAIEENEKALAKFLPVDKSNPMNNRPLCSLSVNCRYYLLYNLGVQMLHDGRPLAAFDCLIESVQVYHCNPRLWLRLAECCIMAFQMTQVEDKSMGYSRKSDDVSSKTSDDVISGKSDLVRSVVGSGSFRKLVLATEDLRQTPRISSTHSTAMPACNLHFGLLCLRNALGLVSDSLTKNSTEKNQKDNTEIDSNNTGTETGQDQAENKFIPAFPSAPVKGPEIQQLKNCILCGTSYTSLVLGDFVLSLEHAQNLLSQPKLSGSHGFLGRLYAAEALVNLGRASEAISHLSPENVTNISTTQSNSSNETAPGYSTPSFPQTVVEARGSFLINLAVAYCLREEYDKAKKCLYQASSLVPLTDLPDQAVTLAIYIELQTGNSSGALQIIKKHQLLPPGKASDKNRKLRKLFM